MISLELQNDILENLHYNPYTGIFLWTSSNCARKKGAIAGHFTIYGYRDVQFKYTFISLHRIAFLFMTGVMPDDSLSVDHINGVRDDNRWCNIRLVSSRENAQNQSIGTLNKSGVMGVCWIKGIQKWRASIKAEGRRIELGNREDWFEAVCLRKSANNKYGFHPGHGKRTNLYTNH
ncbi:MAG: hypothetical protein ACI9DH_000540 [Halioglobus sp.]|jgi:hypothetical protein